MIFSANHVLAVLIVALIGVIVVSVQAIRSGAGLLNTVAAALNRITEDKPLTGVLEQEAAKLPAEARRKLLALVDVVNPDTSTTIGDVAKDVQDWLREILDDIPLADKVSPAAGVASAPVAATPSAG